MGLQRGQHAPVGQDHREDAAGQVAQRVQGAVGFGRGLVEQRRGLLGIVGHQALDVVEPAARGLEPRRDAVVDELHDPPAQALPHGDDALARRP